MGNMFGFGAKIMDLNELQNKKAIFNKQNKRKLT